MNKKVKFSSSAISPRTVSSVHLWPLPTGFKGSEQNVRQHLLHSNSKVTVSSIGLRRVQNYPKQRDRGGQTPGLFSPLADSSPWLSSFFFLSKTHFKWIVCFYLWPLSSLIDLPRPKISARSNELSKVFRALRTCNPGVLNFHLIGSALLGNQFKIKHSGGGRFWLLFSRYFHSFSSQPVDYFQIGSYPWIRLPSRVDFQGKQNRREEPNGPYEIRDSLLNGLNK